MDHLTKEAAQDLDSTSLLEAYTKICDRLFLFRRTGIHTDDYSRQFEEDFRILHKELSKRLCPDIETTVKSFTREEVLRLGEEYDQKVADDAIEIIKSNLIQNFRGEKITINIENYKLTKIQVNKVKDYFDNLGWLVEGGEFGNKFYLSAK
jgi:hypothetical protein